MGASKNAYPTPTANRKPTTLLSHHCRPGQREGSSQVLARLKLLIKVLKHTIVANIRKLESVAIGFPKLIPPGSAPACAPEETRGLHGVPAQTRGGAGTRNPGLRAPPSPGENPASPAPRTPRRRLLSRPRASWRSSASAWNQELPRAGRGSGTGLRVSALSALGRDGPAHAPSARRRPQGPRPWDRAAAGTPGGRRAAEAQRGRGPRGRPAPGVRGGLGLDALEPEAREAVAVTDPLCGLRVPEDGTMASTVPGRRVRCLSPWGASERGHPPGPAGREARARTGRGLPPSGRGCRRACAEAARREHPCESRAHTGRRPPGSWTAARGGAGRGRGFLRRWARIGRSRQRGWELRRTPRRLARG